MTLFSLSFLFGASLLQFFPFLPSSKLIIVVFFACFLLWWFKIRGHFILIAVLLGFAWCLGSAYEVVKFSLLPIWEGKKLWVQGKVASLPHLSPLHSSFLFHVERLQDEKTTKQVSTLILLSWQHSRHLPVGDEWRFPVRLKKIRGTMNPGGFDLEAWAFQNGVRAKGSVFEKEKSVFIARHFFFHPIDQLRQQIQEQSKKYLPISRTSAWIVALMIGERIGIPQSEWEILRNTGTNHLMAIAGLHIGFMSAFAHFITLKIWRRPSWLLFLPASQAAAFASLGVALLYSALAGFSIPTQRALIMLAVYLITTLKRRRLSLWQPFSLALFVVLLINPFSILSSSFWLSFITLALLIYGMSGRLSPQGAWWKWGRPQWILAVGLLPLSLWFFMQFSLLSFFANFVAIPWVGFLVLPLCLVSAFFLLFLPSCSSLTLGLADQILGLLWWLLSWISQLPWAVWYQCLPHYGYLLVTLGGVFILLLPVGFPGRMLGLFWLLPLLYIQPVRPAEGELLFSLLDVGQGLSAVIQTQHHVLVFDTGAHMGSGSDMGESVLVPFLRSQGIQKVDRLVISHGDNDHSGGAGSLLRQFKVGSIKTSVPLQFSAWLADYCLSGQEWKWDGVQFRFLHPTQATLNLDNDSSCVLQIATANKRILLPGDIEKRAEKILVSDPRRDLAADLLVAPHHGSKTSGLRDFINQVHPQYVLYALGYRNRYHFPSPVILQAYRDLGVLQYDTASEGAIQFYVGKNTLLPFSFYRRTQARYWHIS